MPQPDILQFVDQRTGLVRKVWDQTLCSSLPGELSMAIAEMADSATVSGWTSSRSTAGCAWWDPDVARSVAIGEAIEHYCSSLVPGDLRRASYQELVSIGGAAIPWEAYALYDATQYSEPGFPFVPCTPDLRVHWVQGCNLQSGQRPWVPASLVFTSYFYTPNPTRGEPLTNMPLNGGVASGPTWERALTAALEEVIERDAVYLRWVSGAELVEVVPPGWLAALAQGPRGVLYTRFYQFPNTFGMPVIGALMEDTEAGIIVMGTACRHTPGEAALKALAEAVQLQTVARAVDNPESNSNHPARPSGPLKPWRRDRRYRELYRGDWKDVRDQLCHLQLYLDGEFQEMLHERVRSRRPVSLDSLPSHPNRELPVYLQGVARAGMEPIAVDVTSTDVREAGFHTARVIVPGAYSNAPAAFPFLGGYRLREAVQNMGAVNPCLLPLPFA